MTCAPKPPATGVCSVIAGLLLVGCLTPDDAAPGHVPAPDAAIHPDTSPGTVSFSRDIFPVVKVKCALSGCHETGTIMNHVTDFSSEERTYQRWVEGPGTDFCVPVGFISKRLVVPGEPQNSLLIDKITSTRQELCNDAHHPRMPPPPRPPLPAAELELFRTWVVEGAFRN